MKFILLTIGLILCSCSADKPRDILDEDAFVAAMADVHIIESRIMQLRLKEREAGEQLDILYGRLLTKHHITAQQLLDSYNYYMEEEPDLFLALYDRISTAIKTREAAVQGGM